MGPFDYIKQAIRKNGYTLQHVADESDMTKAILAN